MWLVWCVLLVSSVCSVFLLFDGKYALYVVGVVILAAVVFLCRC